MSESELTNIKEQLSVDYEKATFEIAEANEFPDLGDIPRGKAARLTNVGYGFFDLRGFTLWSDQKRDRTVFKVLEPALRALTRVVRLHDGNIEKPTGDGLMFVIGANETDSEKVAMRTLQCAIDLGELMSTVINPFMKQKGHIVEGFGWGIGVEMGHALVAKVGIRNHNFLTSISKAANFASKLENNAGSNEILVGEELRENTPAEVRDYLVPLGKFLNRSFYLLQPGKDSNGKPTLLKAMSTDQARRYGLVSSLLGGPVPLAVLQGAKALSQTKAHRWYGDEEQ